MMLTRARLWLRAVVLRRRLEREMQEEMAEHLDRSAARLVARGVAPAEARRQARREFGNVAVLQEQGRDARGTRWLEALAADARFAVRHFARTPLTTLIMFVVLAVGMTISTLLFSFVHSFAVQPPPAVERADDLVRIRGSRNAGVDGRGFRTLSEEELLAYRALDGHFRAVAGWTDATVPLAIAGDSERRTFEARATFVTGNFFGVLGVPPVLGPGLPPDDASGAADPAASAVAVISQATWDRLFGRRPDAVGSTLLVNGVPVTITGVAPEGFRGLSMAPAPLHVFLPLPARALVLPGSLWDFRAAARLRPGIDLAAATAAVQVVVDRAAADDEQLRALGPSSDVVPLLAVNSDPMFERDVRLMSALVGLLALLVLLVACTNVSALLTGMASARRQEIAIRLSLGAARARVVRQLVTESALLAVVAGTAALALVGLVLHLARTLITALPFEMAVTWPATAFTFGVAIAVGVLFGLSPALHGTRVALSGALRDSGAAVAGRRGRLQRGLVIAQITFTQPLIALVATVLLLVVGEFTPPQAIPFPERMMTVSLRAGTPVGMSARTAAESRETQRRTVERLLERLQGTPGVEGAVAEWQGYSRLGPYAVHPDDRVAGGPEEVVHLTGGHAAPGWFALTGNPVVRGREFAPTDIAVAEPRPASRAEPRAAHAAVILGADVARRLWAGADPIGRRLQVASDSASGARTLVVVGVFEDPMAEERRAGEPILIYLPPDTTRAPSGVLLRTAGDATALLPTMRAMVHEEAGGLLANVRTIAGIQEEWARNLRLAASGISTAGLLALLLSAIGLYAVVAFAVGQRTREIAVRMAVGAPAHRIVRRFVADGVRLAVVGLVLGLPLSLLGLRALLAADSDFPDLPTRPVAAITALGVIAVATAAAWIPARRAAAVDPAVTLRAE